MSKPNSAICPFCGEQAVRVVPGNRCRYAKITDRVYCAFRDRMCDKCGKTWETVEKPTQAAMDEICDR